MESNILILNPTDYQMNMKGTVAVCGLTGKHDHTHTTMMHYTKSFITYPQLPRSTWQFGGIKGGVGSCVLWG